MRDFAEVYDRLMDDFDYPGWASYYLSLAGDIKTLCECGCGTGSMSVLFAARGISVTGIDLSEDMLRIAAEKARKHGVMLPFVRQDMRAFALPRRVDAVFCPCDGVNYLTTEADARAFFRAARKALKPGGALVFDVSSAQKLRAMADAPYFEDRDEITYLWQNRLSGDLLEMALTFFVRRGGGLYERFDERQTQRIFSIDELTGALEAEGFERISVYGDRTMNKPKTGDARWHFAARSPL